MIKHYWSILTLKKHRTIDTVTISSYVRKIGLNKSHIEVDS